MQHAGVQVERTLEYRYRKRNMVELLPDRALEERRLRAAARVDTRGEHQRLGRRVRPEGRPGRTDRPIGEAEQHLVGPFVLRIETGDRQHPRWVFVDPRDGAPLAPLDLILEERDERGRPA